MCPEGRFAFASPGYGLGVASPRCGGAAAAGPRPPTVIDPELPKRKRKSPCSPSVERPRVVTGTAGLTRLGHSLVARSVHSAYSIGVVREWCQPWFTVWGIAVAVHFEQPAPAFALRLPPFCEDVAYHHSVKM